MCWNCSGHSNGDDGADAHYDENDDDDGGAHDHDDEDTKLRKYINRGVDANTDADEVDNASGGDEGHHDKDGDDQKDEWGGLRL